MRGENSEEETKYNIPAFFISTLVVNASVYVFYPITTNIQQVSPSVTIEAINNAGTTGVNKTSANISIVVSKSEQGLISNPGFDTGADGWYYSSDGKLGAVYYSSDDSIAQGVVGVENTVDPSQISDSTLYLFQNFTAPEDISSENVYVRYRLASEPSVYVTYLYIGIYDWDAGQVSWILNGQSVSTSNSYSWYNGTGSVSLVKGKTYAYLIGVRLRQIIQFNSNSFLFLIDYAGLTYTPSVSRYSGNVLGIQSTQNVTMRMIVNSYSLPSNTTFNITLYSDYGSTCISFIDGVPNTTVSNWVFIPISQSSIYYSAKIKIDASSTVNGTGTVDMVLEYIPENGGVSVYYPVKINVTFSS